MDKLRIKPNTLDLFSNGEHSITVNEYMFGIEEKIDDAEARIEKCKMIVTGQLTEYALWRKSMMPKRIERYESYVLSLKEQLTEEYIEETFNKEKV